MLNPTKRTYQVENNLEKHNDLRIFNIIITNSLKRICTPRSLQEELLNENLCLNVESVETNFES